ncbi:MAG: T9SS type A sorting domain-containing protein [Saprospiraceae bacterium]|nr:T9SS type A sorting domain-containing protein [Saprospiraceae bacterium]
MNIFTKIVTLIFGCSLFMTHWLTAQIINIPDPNFKNALINTLCVEKTGDTKGDADADTNDDGEIDVAEALAVTRLYVRSQNINSLTGIEYFTNLTLLSANLNSITALNVTPLTKLHTLEVSDNQLAELHVTNLPLLKILNVTNNQIAVMDLNGTYSLDVLGVAYNNLTELDVAPQTVLRLLNFDHNEITNIDVAGKSKLQVIGASHNPLGSLELTGCPALYAVTCDNCQLVELDVSGQPNLLTLTCSFNTLSSLDLTAQSKLTTLECYVNVLYELDVSGQANLITLICNDNLLNTLNLNNLTKLEIVDCGENKLDSLLLEGCISLSELRCRNNQLTSLNLDYCLALEQLLCDNNQLTILDLTSFNLTSASIDKNQLTHLFLKNGFYDAPLSFQSNPDLAYVCADEAELILIKSKLLFYGNSNTELNGYCSFFPGGEVLTVKGKLRLDSGLDGCNDDDPIWRNLKILVDSGMESGFFLFPGDSIYELKLPTGQHLITPKVSTSYPVTISPASINLTYPGSIGDEVIQDFCITPTLNIPDVGITLTPTSNAIPGFPCKYKLIYTNQGTSIQNGTITLTYDDKVLTLVSSEPNVDIIAPSILTWNFSNLKLLESREIFLEFLANKPTDNPALNSGDILPFVATIIGDPDDIYLADNTISVRQEVLNSFDPNDKSCLNGEMLHPDNIGDYLFYLIRFENTGTFPATNIVVKDVIDITKLDPTSLEVTASSHDVEVRISNSGEVEFIFENIQLPFEDELNDGYVTFRISTLPNLKIGDIIKNQASIYFDFNHPILTNIAQTKVDVMNAISYKQGTGPSIIYPNPSLDGFFFSNPEQIQSVRILDVLGNPVLSLSNPSTGVNTQSWTGGIYTVHVDLITNQRLTVRYVKSGG